ncbi:hypothetical protein WAK64_20470 [Bacillus spongiae]|uniref:Uncharacterized protein n=1 Tax=Bacillus spongiae TaxID=2683610 RepID=A0ABU8HJL9_9BACI
MKKFSTGIIFSLLLLTVFLLLRNGIALWPSFLLSVVSSAIVFIFFIKKKKLVRKDISLISLGAGILFTIIVSIGIVLFPSGQVRDLGDILMPYINAVIFGFCTTVVFILLGITFNKY